MLSSNTSGYVMPLNIVKTFGNDATYLNAHDAVDASGAASFKTFVAPSFNSAKAPPRNGSITITGMPCFVTISYCSEER